MTRWSPRGCARSIRFSASLANCCSPQLADNRARSIAYRIGVARFPVMKNLAEFDFAVSPVNQGLVRELHEGGFLATQRNAVLIGGTDPAS